jgi:tetratricopeptide (TPR) repeat protein
MSNEPKASMNLDPEMLAAYIDKRLSPEQRAEVEAQLARDPDSYAVLVETLRAQDALDGARPVPARSRGRTWAIAAGVLATAAALVVAIVQPDWLGREPSLVALYAAAGPERTIEARLSGYPHAPLRSVSRGATANDNLALLTAAGELERAASQRPDIENGHAAAVGLLLTGRIDEAINQLEQVSTQSTEARYRSDLSAAYAARAARSDDQDDWKRSLDAARRALSIDPALVEAQFNAALAAEHLGSLDEATRLWQDLVRSDADSGWRSEAEQHVAALSSGKR